MDPAPRFLADRMVERLGRWLRIMGVDCARAGQVPAGQVLERALEENRVLLTRDTRLARRRRRPPIEFIQSDHLELQLVQVLRAWEIDPVARACSRCVRCNALLGPLAPAEAGPRVPARVVASGAPLAACPVCGRVYWPGTHRARMMRRLEQLVQAVRSGRSGNPG